MNRPPLLVTKRLVLRELVVGDAGSVAARAGDRRVAPHLLQVPSPYPQALAKRWVTSRIAWWSEGRGLTLAIARRAQPAELLGTVSLRVYARDRRAELGYWLGADHWGRGFAPEASASIVQLGF